MAPRPVSHSCQDVGVLHTSIMLSRMKTVSDPPARSLKGTDRKETRTRSLRWGRMATQTKDRTPRMPAPRTVKRARVLQRAASKFRPLCAVTLTSTAVRRLTRKRPPSARSLIWTTRVLSTRSRRTAFEGTNTIRTTILTGVSPLVIDMSRNLCQVGAEEWVRGAPAVRERQRKAYEARLEAEAQGEAVSSTRTTHSSAPSASPTGRGE